MNPRRGLVLDANIVMRAVLGRRGPASTAEVDFWTSREPREVVHSHVNYVVPNTQKWEQSAAYLIDTHPAVDAFVKNAGLGFAIPYLHKGQVHDYMPDFVVRLKTDPATHLILETKGFPAEAPHRFYVVSLV
jgi:type III restriction enzyme